MEDVYLPFVPVGNLLVDFDSVQLPELDDGVSDEIALPSFPFGNSSQTIAYVRW